MPTFTSPAYSAAALLFAAACCAGCSSSDDAKSSDAASSAATTGASATTAAAKTAPAGKNATIKGAKGTASAGPIAPNSSPNVTIEGMPFSVAETTSEVLVEGTGPVVAKTGKVTVNYHGVNGRDGKVFDSSYGKEPAEFGVSDVVPGFAAGLVGKKVGSQVLIAIPPKDGYGPQGGTPDGAIKADDTIVFFVEIMDAK